MTAFLRDALRRLDRLLQSLRAKIVLSVLVLIGAIVVLVPVHRAATDFGASRTAIVGALDGISLARQDPLAVELLERGELTVGDRVYGGAHLRRHGHLLFANSGEVVNPSMVAEMMLAPERPEHVPAFLLDRAATAWVVIALAAGWGLVIVWLGVTLPFAMVLLGAGAVCLPLWLLGHRSAMVAAAGIGLLAFSFVVLTRLALIALSARAQVLAVAHTTVREATRTGVSLGFIGLLLIALPLIPLGIDDAQPLRYQIQTFISRSLSLTYLIAAAMTLLLSCATVAFEIRDRQIWQLMTKPLSRLSYLLGKFVGVAMLNLILLTICGISIFVFVQDMRMRPAIDPLDAQAVRDEVLTARAGSLAVLTPLTREQLIAQVDEELRNDPMVRSEIESGARDDLDVRRGVAQRLQTDHLARQRQVPAGESREYRFTGLARARTIAAPITLRYLFHAGRSDAFDSFPVIFEFEGEHDRLYFREYRPAQGHVLTVPPEIVNEDGEVVLRIWNLGVTRPEGEGAEPQFYPGPFTIFFDPGDLELMYRVSSFEWNFLRAIASYWVKLCFLAMLGVCCATFLSFPVACILSFTVFAIGSLGPFIAESIEYWSVDSWWRADQVAALWISMAAEWSLRSFGTVRPTESLVEGRVISVGDVLSTFAVIGLLWCGAALLAGWAIFRRRELATYSGHG